MRAPSSLARRAMAHARLRLLATPKTTPVFPSKSMVLLTWFLVFGFWFLVKPIAKPQPETRNQKPETNLLLPFLRRNLQHQVAPIAANRDFDFLAAAQFAERVGVIIDVLHRRLAEPRDQVAGLEPCTLGGRAGAHAVEFHAAALIRVVGDRAEVDAKAAGGRLRFALHFDKGDALRLVGNRRGNLAHESGDLTDAFIVDLVGGVARLVIIVVRRGE